MHIILGASGQVGSAIIDHLIKKKEPIKGVIRNPEKADELKKKGVGVAIADAFDLPALRASFKDGSTVFVLTPESGHSEDVIGDTKTILENYRAAVEPSQIKKIVGLSSIGAQHATGTGNLKMSYMLEHAFIDMQVQQIFIRPAYYYSNWLLYFSTVKEKGVLPTFFAVDLKIPMISPHDVAGFAADVMVKHIEGSPVYELEGPTEYSSKDVATILGQVLGSRVKAEQIPRESWKATLQQAGFSADAVKHFIEMTASVINGSARPERKGTIAVTAQTTLEQYIVNHASLLQG